MPGKESDGIGVLAFGYSTPPCTRLASVEPGCVPTYQARSCWCRPSTDSSNTCWIPVGRLAGAVGAAPAGSTAAVARAVTPIATALARQWLVLDTGSSRSGYVPFAGVLHAVGERHVSP